MKRYAGREIHCWGHFGWLGKAHRSKGIARHLPHLAETEEDLRNQFGEDSDTCLIVPITIRIEEPDCGPAEDGEDSDA